MGRFYQAPNLPQFIDGLYTPPWQLIEKSLSQNQEGYDNAIATSNLFQDIDINAINDPVIKEQVNQIKKYYEDKSNAIAKSIQENPLDWKKAKIPIQSLAKELQKDMKTGDIARIQNAYQSLQNFLKEHEEYAKKYPGLFNQGYNYFLNEFRKDPLRMGNFNWENLANPIDEEKIHKRLKDIAADARELPNGMWKVGTEEVSKEKVLQSAMSQVYGSPENQAFIQQQIKFKNPDYYDEDYAKATGGNGYYEQIYYSNTEKDANGKPKILNEKEVQQKEKEYLDDIDKYVKDKQAGKKDLVIPERGYSVKKGAIQRIFDAAVNEHAYTKTKMEANPVYFANEKLKLDRQEYNLKKNDLLFRMDQEAGKAKKDLMEGTTKLIAEIDTELSRLEAEPDKNAERIKNLRDKKDDLMNKNINLLKSFYAESSNTGGNTGGNTEGNTGGNSNKVLKEKETVDVTLSVLSYTPTNFSDLSKEGLNNSSASQENKNFFNNILTNFKSNLKNRIDNISKNSKNNNYQNFYKDFIKFYENRLKEGKEDVDNMETVANSFFYYLNRHGVIKVNNEVYDKSKPEIKYLIKDPIQEEKNELVSVYENTFTAALKNAYDETIKTLKSINNNKKELGGVQVTPQGSEKYLQLVKDLNYDGFTAFKIDSKTGKKETIVGEKLKKILESDKPKAITASFMGAIGDNNNNNLSLLKVGNEEYLIRPNVENPNSHVTKIYKSIVTSPDYTQSTSRFLFRDYNTNEWSQKNRVTKEVIDKLTTSTKFKLHTDDTYSRGSALVQIQGPSDKVYNIEFFQDNNGLYNAIDVDTGILLTNGDGYVAPEVAVGEFFRKMNLQ